MLRDIPQHGRLRRTRRSLAVVKLGGSHTFAPHLRSWLEALAGEAGSVIVVPGGGPFADAVRAAQGAMGFDDAAAHEMALAAMAQFGRALQSVHPTFRLAASRARIAAALREKSVAVWSPAPMALAAGLPASWELTSDSLAAWLAGELGAERLILVKHGRFPHAGTAAARLAADGVVDPLFPSYLAAARCRAFLAGPDDAANLAGGLRGARFPEILLGEETGG